MFFVFPFLLTVARSLSARYHSSSHTCARLGECVANAKHYEISNPYPRLNTDLPRITRINRRKGNWRQCGIWRIGLAHQLADCLYVLPLRRCACASVCVCVCMGVSVPSKNACQVATSLETPVPIS
uniref:Putative secreted protein n=1 Tax=Anopheles triannulatus TaxID=58253 RepID=A0A2M4B3C9_9DIPT